MKVLIVMTLAEQRGGAEMALLQLARDGRDHGIEWRVVFLEPGPMVNEVESLGVPASVVPAGRLRHARRYVRSVSTISSIAKDRRADLVFSWMTKAHLYGGVAASMARLPSVWYQHGIPSGGWMDRLSTMIPAQGVIATSEAAAAAQARIRPVRAHRVVHPGIDLERFDPGRLPPRAATRRQLGLPVDAPLVGYFGRLQRWKGAHVLIEAIPRVLEAMPDARCVIVGGRHDLEPDYPDHLRDLIAAGDGLRDHVSLVGFQSDVPRWMHAMDVVALPSRNEPFGITVVEAMALGKPVVAGDTGGPREIIDSGVNGVLITNEDARALAAAITDYLLRPDHARRVGAAARERAEHFSASRYADGLARAIRVLARR